MVTALSALPRGSKVSTSRAVAMSPASQSRQRLDRLSQHGSLTESRPSISRRCLACASKTSRGLRFTCDAMRLGNIGTFTARFELLDLEMMMTRGGWFRRLLRAHRVGGLRTSCVYAICAIATYACCGNVNLSPSSIAGLDNATVLDAIQEIIASRSGSVRSFSRTVIGVASS
jgi:hypothetical protein